MPPMTFGFRALESYRAAVVKVGHLTIPFPIHTKYTTITAATALPPRQEQRKALCTKLYILFHEVMKVVSLLQFFMIWKSTQESFPVFLTSLWYSYDCNARMLLPMFNLSWPTFDALQLSV